MITIWLVEIQGKGGQIQQKVVRLGISPSGQRSPALERLSLDLLSARPSQTRHFQDKEQISSLIKVVALEPLHRHLNFKGHLSDDSSYSSRLLARLEISG
ncbi:MAG: hypothetical protein LBT86_06900 [Deltaproteobacteria bacterium]|nr:hypothetical protein [Deltaproteobacteria bacterium]